MKKITNKLNLPIALTDKRRVTHELDLGIPFIKSKMKFTYNIVAEALLAEVDKNADMNFLLMFTVLLLEKTTPENVQKGLDLLLDDIQNKERTRDILINRVKVLSDALENKKGKAN